MSLNDIPVEVVVSTPVPGVKRSGYEVDHSL